MTFLLQLIGLVPGLFGFAQNLLKAKWDADVQKFMAATGASRDVAVAALQMQGQVQTKWWFVAIVPPLFALPFIVYTWKAIMYDKVIAPFIGIDASTDPIGGTLGWVFTMVVGYYFLHNLSGANNGKG